ncbi:MAG TPA: hypothetical protein PKK60_02885, partial [archaeon]|nr:hypothetical protein [archaeon]
AQTNSIPPVIRDEYGAVASSTIWKAYRSTKESEVQLPVFKKVHSKGEEKIYDNLLWFSNLSVGFLLPTYLSEINDFTNGMDFGYDTSNYLVKKSYSSASFMPEGYSSPGTTPTTGSIKWGSGIGSVVGAIIGAYIGYLAAEDSLYKCAENFQIGEFSDFVIFLQGDTMSVATPDGESTEERTIPSDAGALNFTLSGVSTAWDFSDADYGEEENVGIRFTNAGLNDAQPKYGTLTINATKHIHGSLPDADGDTSTGSGSDTDFDVFCHDGNFGNYWIGANAGEGSCTGVTATEYSQKYHIRVISGESNDSSAYLSKESSCNNGILVGSTGPDALPKIKLNWDWDAIKEDTCSYENEDYVYCDATQTTISLVKKLADLEDFLKLNQATGCPNDSIYAQTVVVNNEINSYIDTVAEGYIGPEEISISVIDDVMTAKIKVNNKTGGAVESFYSYTIKGSGEPVVPEYPTEKTFPAGISEETITANISKYEGVYFFTVVFNGNKGNRRALTRAFENREAITDSCWIERTTRSVGGLPAISYYLNDSDQINWTSEITNISDLFDHINFGSYLIRDSYNEDFIIDFRNYYITNFGEKMTETERKILDYLASGKVKFSKRFSGDTDFEAGLYDVWFYIDFTGETLSIIDSNADIEISLLSIRNPIETYPFYYIPFDGLVGEETIRNGYGATYKNLTEGKNNELKITTKDVLNTVSTFENVSGNGVVTVNTKKGGNLVSTNSTVGTRGQLASISYSDYEATFTFTPNYATTIIMKKTLNGTTGLASFKVLKDEQEVNVGGNFSYWTGAAKSKDFYGSAAIDVYEDSPDYELEQGGYGFEWIDASFNGNLYLKTIIYTPTGESYVIESDDSTTKFWTPNGEFTDSQELIGISGMNNNNQLNLSTFESLQDLLDLVKEKKVCISNDGSNMTFWWNQKTISTTAGTQSSLEDYELSLIGK